jgi:hypothetical protein
MTDTQEIGGYPLFFNVRNPSIRTWNRLNIIYNIKEFLRNNSLAIKYFKQFKDADRKLIWELSLRVKKEGYANVRRAIFRANNH